MDQEQIRAQREKCLGCGGQLQEIQLIDKADNNVHTGPEYAAAGATPNRWTGGFPIQGQILAFLCSHCGRIELYGAGKTAASENSAK